MFLPAAVAGVLLGIIIWVCALLLLRTYGHIRTLWCGHTNKVQDRDHIELKPGQVMVARGGGPDILWESVQEKHGPRVMESTHHQTASSRYFDTGKVQEFNQSVVDLVRRGYMASEQEDTEPASSSRSSPKSISSGIGVSEKESHSEKEEEEEEYRGLRAKDYISYCVIYLIYHLIWYIQYFYNHRSLFLFFLL